MKFKDLHTLPFYSQFIFSLLIHVVNNKHLFNTNMDYHNYKTRYKLVLHQPTVKLAKYYKGPYNLGLKTYNHLLEFINELSNNLNSFKKTLKGFLYQHSFYTVEEYFNFNFIEAK
jgi:hypothetical protein